MMLVFPDFFRQFKQKRRLAEMERDLPLLLRSIAVDLQFKTPFEQSLRNASVGYGVLSEEFSKISSDVKLGLSVPEALRRFGQRSDCVAVKRAVAQLVFSYENGFASQGIRKLADELVQQQRIKSREFAAKQAFFGLMFITLSTIVPALFSAFVIVGSVFLDFTFSSSDVWIAFAVLFPALDFTVLYYLSEAKPKVL
ncbi:TPA: type II secretion system F family protein [Candidatus Micrarchaeota archaeon]|nr:type II secretion system F family protein [Candidatus Micrarchaeota archaeon]